MFAMLGLFPSSDFIAKNQLANEGCQSVSPVTITVLTTIVYRQFEEDMTLCPVQALRYYLDQTKDLRGSQSLLFISFKKGHTSDIRPDTLSSWLKQTILRCYKQADHKLWTWSKLKCMSLGPSQPLRPFTVGYRWTTFLPKPPYLVRQRHQYVFGTSPRPFPSDQLSSERKEAGPHLLQPSLQESKSQGLGIRNFIRMFG